MNERRLCEIARRVMHVTAKWYAIDFDGIGTWKGKKCSIRRAAFETHDTRTVSPGHRPAVTCYSELLRSRLDEHRPY